MHGVLTSNKQLSLYQPSKEVIAITKDFANEFGEGVSILNRAWNELNDYSVIDRMNRDQRAFNAFVDETFEDPRESWKWRGTRSIARNRIMAMHAHLTASLAIPMVFAQNEKQEEDVDMSNIGRDILDWIANNSDYKQNYILASMGALVNPVTYLGIEWVENYTKVKEKTEEGFVTKDVLDEELSGIRTTVYSADQILLTNAYEQNIQRHRAVLKRRYVDYYDSEKKWHWHENWYYVQKGVRTLYSDEEGLFYDVRDFEHPNLIEEVVGWSRRTDTEVAFLNGIYMGTPNVDFNPIKHRDNFNQPKVPLTPFGYERINEHFFFWKSLANRVGWDNSLIDSMYENTMNRETLDIGTPLAISGAEDIDESPLVPYGVVAFESPDAEAKPILPPSRGAGYKALREIENSITESSISETQMGQLPEASQKAFTVARAEQNARTILRGAFRSMGESVARFGSLAMDEALQHLTAPQLDEITGELHYRPFILKDQMVGGKKISKKILFTEELYNMTPEKAKEKSLKLLNETGYPKTKKHIYLVNPHLFSKMKYLIKIEPDVMMEKNEAFEKATTERLYALLRNDPLVSAEFLVRKLLQANYRGEADEAIVETQTSKVMGLPPELGQKPEFKEAVGKLSEVIPTGIY